MRPLNESTFAPRVSVVFGEPSPQLIMTVCTSSVPGSAKLPLREIEPFSSIVAALATTETLAGGTLLTVMDVVPLTPPPPAEIRIA